MKIFFCLIIFNFYNNVKCEEIKSKNIGTSAQSAIIICADSGDIVWAKNAFSPMPMASTTKIMTSILALEAASALGDKEIKITSELANIEGSSMGLEEGDVVKLSDLVHGMLLPSGNDAANAAAVSVSGSIEEFIKLMNERAIQIGMKNTCFCTPSGLDFGNHHSTAYDMAILGAHAMENEQFANIASKKRETILLKNENYGNKKLYLKNHNKLLKLYDKCIGIKTGFTKIAKRCLVSCAQNGHIRLVVVTLDDPNDWMDHILLYEYGFKNTINKTFDDSEFKTNVIVNNAEELEVSVSSKDKFFKTFKSGIENSEIQRNVELEKSLNAPLNAGQVVGKISYIYKDKIIGINEITVDKDVKEKQLTFFEKIIVFFKRIFNFFFKK